MDSCFNLSRKMNREALLIHRVVNAIMVSPHPMNQLK
jgi:hypothetical protein